MSVKPQLVGYGIGVIGLLGILCLTPARLLFDHEFLSQQLSSLGSGSVFLYLAIYSLSTMVGIPGTVLTVAGAMAFGLIQGTLWSVIGATLGAILAFGLARTLLHDRILRRFGRSNLLMGLNRSMSHSPFLFVLAIRLAPISPFNVINFLFGLTPIPLLPYSLGTFLGIIPGTFAYTWVVVSGDQALHGAGWGHLIMALSLLLSLILIPMGLRRICWRRAATPSNPLSETSCQSSLPPPRSEPVSTSERHR